LRSAIEAARKLRGASDARRQRSILLSRTLNSSIDELGKPGNDDFYGLGRVNALRAVLQ
jgi:hypothetical protein